MPVVSIVIPCLNEEKNITDLLDALVRQTFSFSDVEVIIVDGNSRDQTLEKIAQWQAAHPDAAVVIVENPKRIIPAALNSGIALARGEWIIRMDAHSIPAPDYIERCVAALQAGRADNVGGRWEIQPGADTWIARGIAQAASSPLGVGDAKYRYAEEAEYVDTVPYGAYSKATLDAIGGYDETLPVNEDYDLNVRLRRGGGKIWFDPAIRCVYYARSTLAALAKQYGRYGYWKVRMLKKDPKSIKPRQLVPPLFVAGVALLALGSFFWKPFSIVLSLLLILYIMALLFTAIRTAGKEDDLSLLAGMPLAIIVMHFSWGGGFIWSLIKLVIKGA